MAQEMGWGKSHEQPNVQKIDDPRETAGRTHAMLRRLA